MPYTDTSDMPTWHRMLDTPTLPRRRPTHTQPTFDELWFDETYSRGFWRSDLELPTWQRPRLRDLSVDSMPLEPSQLSGVTLKDFFVDPVDWMRPRPPMPPRMETPLVIEPTQLGLGTVSQWFGMLSIPQERRETPIANRSGTFAAPPWVNDILVSQWFDPLDVPRRRPARLTPDGLVRSVEPTHLDFGQALGWFDVLSVPVRRVHRPRGMVAEPWITPTSFDFYVGLHALPVRYAGRPDGFEVKPIEPTSMNLGEMVGWRQPLSVPLPRPDRSPTFTYMDPAHMLQVPLVSSWSGVLAGPQTPHGMIPPMNPTYFVVR